MSVTRSLQATPGSWTWVMWPTAPSCRWPDRNGPSSSTSITRSPARRGRKRSRRWPEAVSGCLLRTSRFPASGMSLRPGGALDGSRACRRARRSCAAEHRPQLLLRPIENAAPLRAEIPARPVDVEVQHRHGGAERLGLAPATRLRGALERKRNLPRTPLREDAGLQVERVALLHDTVRPPGACLGRGAPGLAGRAAAGTRTAP